MSSYLDRDLGKVLCLAVFVSDHGFGHGTRICAVIREIKKRTSCTFEIFSGLPEWFFKQNLGSDLSFNYHEIKSDVGLIQRGPFKHSIKATIRSLDEFLEFDSTEIIDAQNIISKMNCNAVLADISPLGIHLAKKLSIPSILVENFTWDWIYQPYSERHPEIRSIISFLSEIYESVDLLIQATPFCNKKKHGISIPPISRSLKIKPHLVRSKLNIPKESHMFLMTTGGITQELQIDSDCVEKMNCIFLQSSDQKEIKRIGNIIYLPTKSPHHYPDLVNASDVVVGKVGYGTLAECWATGTPLLGCYREDFRESSTLKAYAEKNLISEEITMNAFEHMTWVEQAINISNRSDKGIHQLKINGRSTAADLIVEFIN